MHTPCLWYQEEQQRQIDEQYTTRRINGLDEEDEAGNVVGFYSRPQPAAPWMTLVMPNGDSRSFDLCLIHGEIKALGVEPKASNGRDEVSNVANPD